MVKEEEEFIKLNNYVLNNVRNSNLIDIKTRLYIILIINLKVLLIL